MRFRGYQPQTNWIMPPMFTAGVTGATGQTYSASGPIVLGVTTGTPTILDLTTICGTPAKAPVSQGHDDWNPNPLGHRLLMQADGDNIYFAFGDSPASLATISPTAVTAVQSGQTGPTGAALATFTQAGGTSGCAKLVKDAAPLPIELPPGRPPPGSPQDNADVGRYSPARYLAFVAGSTSSGVYLRIWQGSD